MSKFVQLEGIARDISIFGNILLSVAKKGTNLARDLGKYFLDKRIERLIKEYITGSGITLTNNEIKDIIKVIKSLKNRGILLKEATRKITSQEEGFLNLPLMKRVLTPLTKSVLIPIRSSAGMSAAADAAIQKKIYESGTTALIILNEEMEDIVKIVKSLEELG